MSDEDNKQINIDKLALDVYEQLKDPEPFRIYKSVLLSVIQSQRTHIEDLEQRLQSYEEKKGEENA
jgi:cobalamin biosynthesis Co2+ chelatase CbiK